MKKSVFIALVVSIGGFLYGFDAGIISGVMEYFTPQYNLSTIQQGWVPASPLFAAMFAMLVSGRISDLVGRKPTLIVVAFLYALSALMSAYASGYTMLWVARMIGGAAFGAALVIAPVYIAEVSSAKMRGTLVSIQQLNIVLGFFAAFLSNYFFNDAFENGTSWLTKENIWRWMLGVELVPALLYFVGMFFVPKSPRWLFVKAKNDEANKILKNIHGEEQGQKEAQTILTSLENSKTTQSKIRITNIFKKSFRYILIIAIVIGIIQQVTGINAVYYYATSIFKQTGVGTNSAFFQGVLLSMTAVVFTIVGMFLIDRVGRRPLFLVGLAGIAISMLLCGYGFHGATYTLTPESISDLNLTVQQELTPILNQTFDSDLSFKNELKDVLGDTYLNLEGALLEAGTHMNSTLVLVGILGFIACFSFSLGPVMWVLLSEIFPNRVRGLFIGFIGFLNGIASFSITQIFPWELANIGSAATFYIYGTIALIGFLILLKILPETKGKSLEEIEQDLVKAA